MVDTAQALRRVDWVTRPEFAELCARFGNACAYCGGTARRLIPEHVEPLSRGGLDALENIVPACQPCNASKRDMLLLEWRFVQAGWLRRFGHRPAPAGLAAIDVEPARGAVRLQIREVRDSCGWTQAELARRAGIRRATVIAMENHRTRGFDFASLEQLADALGVDAGFLIVHDRTTAAREERR